MSSSKKRRRRRSRRKPSILGPLFLEFLALLVFTGLFFAVQEARKEKRSEISGSFPSVAYSENGNSHNMSTSLANTAMGWKGH